MKPPFAYYGGKSRLADLIVSLMPPHRVYVEPFAGSLAVLFAKTPVSTEVVNDIDGAIVAFFRVLRDMPNDLERVCSLTPYARDEWNAASDIDDIDDIDDLEIARRFWTRVTQSFAKHAGSHTGWSFTTKPGSKGRPHTKISRFRDCAERLTGVQIENCDAADLIRRCRNDETVIYCDPPYLYDVRSGSSDYRHDMGTVETHDRLADALHKTTATVFLSGYRSDLYDRLYDGWDRLDITVPVSSQNASKSSRGTAVECIWSNRPIAAQGRLDLDAAEVTA